MKPPESRAAEDDQPLLIEHRAKNGDILEFDIARTACDLFGFYYSDRVETPLGPASVVGVRDNCLWFLIDGDPGVSFWDNAKSYVDLLSLGITLINTDRPLQDKKGYKVKTITFKGKNIPIVLQNENGPCPLIGISNILALRSDIVIEGEGPNKNAVSLESLIEKLSAYLLAANMDKDADGVAEMIEKATKLMPQLQFGLDVNFNFKECDNFEKTEQCKLLEQFLIRMLHGWLVDPNDLQTSGVIGDSTYNDLMNKLVALDEKVAPTQAPSAPDPSQNPPPANPKSEETKPPTAEEGAAIRAFLEGTQSQLTPFGLAALQRTIREGELCIFFRNNHFSTLTKHEGKLYILVTDVGYERERNIVWDLLTTVDGSSVFCNGEFKTTDQTTREELVNTLELMGFSKGQIDSCLPLIPKEDMVNSDAAIAQALQIINKQTNNPTATPIPESHVHAV